MRLHLDYGALGEVLRSADLGGAMADAAGAVASELRSRGIDATVETYTTDRAAASVSMPLEAEGMELKYGTLTDAARAAGFEVTER